MLKKLLVSLALLTALLWGFGLDEPISRFIYTLRSPELTRLLRAISFAGSKYVLIPLCIGIFISLRKKSRWMAWAIPLGTLSAWLSSEILKQLIARARPELSPLATETSYSFPSGHAMSNTAFYLLILMWAPNNRFARFFCGLMIILMNFSRVYLGVHWTSDVLGGTALALIIVEAVFVLTKKRLRKAVSVKQG